MKRPGDASRSWPVGLESATWPAESVLTDLLPHAPLAGSRAKTTSLAHLGERDSGVELPGAGRRVGRYRLVEPLGAGGQAVVWRAVLDGPPPREVALKLLLTSSGEHRSLARLRREAERGIRLVSPAILAVTDFGIADGIAYLAMPIVEGGSLAEALAQRRRRASGPPLADDLWLATLPEPEYARAVARVGVRVARALQDAHEARVIHCDVKPSNILMDRRRPARVYLTDFGMGRDLDAVTPEQLRDLSGTPMYMAPEKVLGQPADGRLGDLYALGVTLFEALTGVKPFLVSEAPCLPVVLMAQFVAQEPLRPRAVAPRLSRDLEAIILKAMARDPSRRYPRAAALAEDLERFLAGRPVGSGPRPRSDSPWAPGGLRSSRPVA